MTMIPADLERLRKLYMGFMPSRVILTANNLGVFDSLKKPSSAMEISGKLKIDLRAAEILLDALTGIGLLTKDTNVKYRNTPLSTNYLTKGGRFYHGDIIKHASNMWENFSALDEVVRTGRPARRGSGFDHESFIMGMHNLTVLRSESLIKAVGLKGVKTALDLGGGPGTNAIAIARKGIRTAIFDVPETIKIARKVVRREGVKGIGFIAGDFHVDNIGSGYDLILVSQIFHAFSAEENITLLHKCRAAVNPGGRVAVQEFPINDARTAPFGSALFSVNMLVGTDKGRCYTPKEIKRWLAEAGFKNAVIKNLPETVLIMGRLEN
jgi:ubiquinone/menaquinone biosynthesis C-methylase UbiE